jgi:hypothetical protein
MINENLPIEEEELGDDIFGTDVYEAQRPPKKDFLPWHKPRKQFVRHFQWCEQVNLLLGEIRPDGGILKYLGLPGVDLLDLRHFHTEICKPKDIRLRFLGFNSGASPKSKAHTELNISLGEVCSLDLIDIQSVVMPDDFCRVADTNSLAWKKAKDFGPYDVVNLDLCDGFAVHEPSTDGTTYYDALNCLIALQARRKDPWLLFLTTRTGRQDINELVLEKLLETYMKNLNNYPKFNRFSKACLTIEDDETLRAIAATPDGHLTVFLVGLCKWMLGLALGQNPPCKIEVKSTIGYRVDVGADHDDLVSIALKFEPTFGSICDPAGLSMGPVAAPNEGNLAVKILGRVLKRISADKILADDVVLYEKMLLASESLLALARYDIGAYRDWVQAN